MNTLVLSNSVLEAGGILAWSPGMMIFSSLKCHSRHRYFIWLFSDLSGILLEISWDGQKILPNLPNNKSFRYMEIAAIHKRDPVHSICKRFLSHVLLLVLVIICTEIKWFCTCPALQQCQAVLCSLLVNQEENVSQHCCTTLTWVALLGRWRCLGILCLWRSYRNAVFNGCLHILFSTAASWRQRNVSEIYFDLLKRR